MNENEEATSSAFVIIITALFIMISIIGLNAYAQATNPKIEEGKEKK